VASHLKRFRDLNPLLCTSRFLRSLFHSLLYRRAITATGTVCDDIVSWVLSEYQVVSLMHLLDNRLSVNRKFGDGRYLLHMLYRLEDKERSVPLARLLLERGADIDAEILQFSFPTLVKQYAGYWSRLRYLLAARCAFLLISHQWRPGRCFAPRWSLYSGHNLLPKLTISL
jgi:hypothetical protein